MGIVSTRERRGSHSQRGDYWVRRREELPKKKSEKLSKARKRKVRVR